MVYEWPICARCARGVESIKREIDYFTGDVIYTVSCHGQQVVQVVRGLDLHDAILIMTTAYGPPTNLPIYRSYNELATSEISRSDWDSRTAGGDQRVGP